MSRYEVIAMTKSDELTLAEMCRCFHDGDRDLLGLIQDLAQDMGHDLALEWCGTIEEFRTCGRDLVRLNPLMSVSFSFKSPSTKPQYESRTNHWWFFPNNRIYEMWVRDNVVGMDDIPLWFFEEQEYHSDERVWIGLPDEAMALVFISEMAIRWAVGRPYKNPKQGKDEFLLSNLVS